MTMNQVSSKRSSPVIRPRSPVFDFKSVPRHWLANSSLATQIANGVNLLFPLGERFFVRSVRFYENQITDPELREQVKNFAGQEVRHARAHEAFFEVMEGHGYHLEGFMKFYEKLAFGWIEPMAPPALRLAMTAASEHFTALLAEAALIDGTLDAGAHPVMLKLLKWHACEEIEHRAVAFDVLQKVDPRYRTRALGMALATVLLAGFWAAATANLLWQDRAMGRALNAWDREVLGSRKKSIGKDIFWKGMKQYLRRDFHPLDEGHLDVAMQWLREAGLEPPESPSATPA